MTNEISGTEQQPAQQSTVDDGITYTSTTNPEANTVKPEKALEDKKVEQQPAAPENGTEEGGEEEAQKKKSGGYKKKAEKLAVENMQKDAELQRMKAELEKYTKPAAHQGESKEAAANNTGEPLEIDFESPLDFIKAHNKWSADQAVNGYKAEQEKLAQEKVKFEREAAHEMRVHEFVQSTPDYAEKVSAAINTGLVTPKIEDAVLASSMSERVAYHLGENPADLVVMNQIANNPQALNVAIKTIENFIKSNSDKAAVAKKTNATAPITPIGKSASTPVQKDFKDMSVAEMEAWRYGRNK